MPNRIIKDSICTNEQIDRLTPFEETFFYRLIVNADDYGRMDGRPKILAARLFPLKDIRSEQIEKALCSLTSAELVTLYNVGGKPFVRLCGWERNQSIRAKRSKYPGPEESDPMQAQTDGCESRNVNTSEINCMQTKSHVSRCMQMHADVPVIQSESESESESEAKSARATRRFAPPTVSEVQDFVVENRLSVDAQRFVDFYASKGWLVGKSPMKDWRAACRGWARRDAAERGNSRSPQRPNPALQYEQRAHAESDYDDLYIDLNKLYGEGGDGK